MDEANDSRDQDAEPRPSLLDRLRQALGKGRANTAKELEREIQGLVDQGEAKGLISTHEGDMIEAVLELGQTTAGQIMVPRIELAMVSDSASVEEVIKVIVESGHSRIPVFAEVPDQIKGVIHAKDLLTHWGQPTDEVDLASVLRQPFFVPQSMPIDELLTAFKRRRVHLAVVVDEYGGTAGVVSMEDVLEEIVGEIEDEYDQEEEFIQQEPDGALLVDARLEIEDLSEQLGVELPDSLPEGRFETVGGFITTLLGRVPRAEEEVEWGPARFTVVEADDRRITKVRVSLAELTPAASGE